MKWVGPHRGRNVDRCMDGIPVRRLLLRVYGARGPHTTLPVIVQPINRAAVSYQPAQQLLHCLGVVRIAAPVVITTTTICISKWLLRLRRANFTVVVAIGVVLEAPVLLLKET